MPIYEYKCLDCETHFEKLQKATDEPLKTCESCGGNLEKQWSLSGFQFKGEGWYITDYSDKNKKLKSEKTENSEKKSTTESTAKTETASNNSSKKSVDSTKATKKD